MHSDDGHLTLEQYLELGRKRSTMTETERQHVHKLFMIYKLMARSRGLWDSGDLAFNLYERLRKHGPGHIVIDFVFGDEIQDFLQAEIAILLRLSQNPNQLFLCGDSAQTIARGVGFRFKDLHALWFHEFAQPPEFAAPETRAPSRAQVVAYQRRIKPTRLKLLHNYRSHKGSLALASDVIRVVETLFPENIDKMQADMGVLDGPKPVLLETRRAEDLLLLLLGNIRSTASIEFGAHQVVLVRDDAARRELPPQLRLALVMTVYEAKGLEFDDVLLYNFFRDSPADKEWSVLDSFRLDPALSRKLESATVRGAAVAALDDSDDEGVLSKAASRVTGFDPEKHKLLESELKFLYTAITRSRVNVWIYDESRDKREPFFALCRDRRLVDVVTSLRDSNAAVDDPTSGLFAKSTTPAEWLKRGSDFLRRADDEDDDPIARRGMLRVAADCFRFGGADARAARAEARALFIDAQELGVSRAPSDGKQRHNLAATPDQTRLAYVRAARAALECGAYLDATRALRAAKEHKLAAELCESVGMSYARRRLRKMPGGDTTNETTNAKDDEGESLAVPAGVKDLVITGAGVEAERARAFLSLAGRQYALAHLEAEAARCLERAGDFGGAIKLLRSERLYLQALEVVERQKRHERAEEQRRNAALLESVDAAGTAEHRELVYLAAREHVRLLERTHFVEILCVGAQERPRRVHAGSGSAASRRPHRLPRGATRLSRGPLRGAVQRRSIRSCRGLMHRIWRLRSGGQLPGALLIFLSILLCRRDAKGAWTRPSCSASSSTRRACCSGTRGALRSSLRRRRITMARTTLQ